jgi:5-methylcytosine-specific restriction protein A
MSLSELTDPDAVRRAIAEFDALGREAFLQKYRFRPARSYFLIHETRRYDSKAIAGVAVGIQRPDLLPLKSADFSGGEATVRKKLQQLGFEVAKDANQPKTVRNPPWTREETILALDLYVRRRPQLPGEGDREILALSTLLKLYGAQRGIIAGDNFRSADGVSMKIANLSRLEPTDKRKGLPHGAAAEEKVWQEFMPDPTGLAAKALALRLEIEEGVPSRQNGIAASAALELASASRGPRPSFGDVIHTRTDGETSVYVMRLQGRLIESLFPDRDLAAKVVLKLGRSNDVLRRAVELNCGFPPGLDLAWIPLLESSFANADNAHDAEQSILRLLERRGFAIGGEFAIVPETEVPSILAALG